MSTQQLSVDRPLGAAAVGCLQIRKWFMNEETGVRQLYRGTVIRFYKKDEHYKVLYEDSDIEDLEWKDMMKCSPQLIADDSADPPADDTTNPPAKRRKTAEAQDFSAAAAAAGLKQKQQQQPKTQKHPKQEMKQPKAAAADAAAAGVKSPQAAGAARPSRKQEQAAAAAGPAGAGAEQRAGTSTKQHGAQQPPAAAVQGAGRATRAAAAAAGAEHSKGKAAPVAAAGADKSAGKAAKQLNTEEAPAAAPAGRNRKNPAATDAAVAKPSKSAAGAEKSKAPKQQGTAKPSVDVALGKGRPKSAAADAAGAKPGKGAAAAGVAGAAAHGVAASAGVPKGAKQGAGKQANNKAAAASAAAKAAVAAAKAKARPAAAAGAGAGAAAKPSKASAAKGKTQAAAAAAAAGGVGTSKAQKQRKKQQQGDVQAAADQQPKAQGPQPPWVEPMPKYGPANVCEEHHRAGRDAYLADMKGIARAAQQAHEVVCMDDGAPMWEAAARIQEGETPEIRKQVEDKLFPIAKDAQDAMRLLSKKAARFEKGKEPYRRFALPPHIMELLKDPKDSAKLAAAAAAMEPLTADKPKRRVKKAASAEAAAGAESAGGADSAADSSAAAEAAAGGATGSSKKAAKKQGGKKRQADTAAEADQQQKKRSKKQKTGVKSAVATGAAAAAGDDDAAAAAVAAAAPAGQESEEVEWLIQRQWETLWVPMEEFADPDGKLALAIQKQKTDFDWEYRTACVTEEERVTQGKLLNPDAKLSRRPDRVTESAMQDRKVNDRGGFGHVPGFKVNSKFELRALCSLAGMHKVPVAGMVFASVPNAVVVNGKVYEGLKAVTSVVSSGTYSANKDAQANEDVAVTLIYTGQGSNDLLGGKAQMDDQVLQGANAYMLVNWALGIPVRYLRRNDDSSSSTNSAIIYDGLYWVVSACRQWVDGQDRKTKQPIKCLAYVFGLKRIPGQPESLSKPIPHWKAAGTAQKGKCTIERRAFGMCRDASKGVESTALEATADTHAKAAAKVAATNAVDNMLPPGLDPKEDQALLLKAPQGRTWVKDPRPFRYIRQPKYTSNVKLPQPPKLVIAGSRAAADAEEAIRANAAAGGSSGCGVFIPPKYANAPMWNKDHMICTREEVEDAEYGPHRLLARLNGGKLPYRMHTGGKGSKNVVVAQSGGGAPRVLIECGPWTGCKLGDKCPQRQALRALQFQFEVYKTPDCGLGLMSWQNIPASALVCIMVGEIFRAEDVGPGTAHGDSSYVFNLAPRPDTDHLGGDLEEQKEKEQQQQQHGAQGSGQEAQGSAEGAAGAACCSKGQQTENGEQQQQQTNKGAKETTHDHKAKYVLDARDEGNLARFINHSCDPNLYVQPILSGHTDTDHVLIGLFAMRNIPAFTPLSYDYGVQYILEDFGGVCKCGADCCYSKLPQNQQQQQAEASTAPSPSAAAAAAAAGGIKRKGCNGAGCSKQR